MAELNSNAERFAERATKLPAFRNLNLGGVKDQVAEILSLIGRVEGIFSTYTKHDISHIDTMLAMLDWIVPPKTRDIMSPVDWLMAVLGIYLHDLGMVVTTKEYLERLNNPEFVAFLEKTEKDPDLRDYLARSESMSSDERDRFFYQEFVRKHHATRIREWITGRHSRFWGENVRPFTEEIGRIMSNLPTRFREHLGVVCESHHKDDLDKTDVYPLAQRYGNDRAEIANVQYAALILRTVDLIHVTKDRTPSIMYSAINFSDLKSIDEWDKQIGTFAVHMKGREFNARDLESHVIEVDADFTEERPFFALTEYLSYADTQIKQTKQWADISQQNSDGQYFNFPWRAIRGDIRVEGNLPRQMRFELDRGRLLNLLVGHTIYNEPTVAVRELLQNAVDALRFQYYIDQKNVQSVRQDLPKMGQVLINWNPESRELIIQDNGIGMDLNIIENHLLRVGSSFYASPQFQTENADFTPISRFGIGILTCFMISDNIEIITFRSGEGRRIRMTSVQADYLLKDIKSGDAQLEGLEPHGTRVRLVLRPSVNLAEKSILEIVRQWVIIPECDVVFTQSGSAPQKIGFANAGDALRELFGVDGERTDHADEIYEVITVEPEGEDGAEYELSFVVRRGYFPERSFVSSHSRPAAGVCIEGIRADWHLPGFSQNLCALLSVRNNKKFRTTVSRESLEIDEEYGKIANLCAKHLFSHVDSEIERIAALEGKPLLRASTAGRWVYDSLLAHATGFTGNTLKSLYANVPLVVTEGAENQDERAENRRLQSLKEIGLLPKFWTVESRAVDYLGVISRDLGRELNITNFLSTLAPELYDPKVNLILVDPNEFYDELRETHSVSEADFSRKHQRTLLKWEPTPKRSDLILRGLHEVDSDGFDQNAVALGLPGLTSRRGPQLRKNDFVEYFNLIIVARTIGDIEGVHGVKTRMVTVLSDESQLGDLWLRLNQAWILTGSGGPTTLERSHLLLGIITLALSSRNFRYDRRRGANELVGPWRALAPQLNLVLKKLQIESSVPSDLEELMGDDTKWFDVSWFWRNWATGD